LASRPAAHPLAEIAAILDPGHEKVDPLPPVSDSVQQRYADEGGESRFRLAIKDAINQLKAMDAPASRPAVPTTTAQLDQQRKRALADQVRLESLGQDLRRLGDDLREESPRWQANYDFVVTRVLAQLVRRQELIAQLNGLRGKLAKGGSVRGFQFVPDPMPLLEESGPLLLQREAHLKRLAKLHKGSPWVEIAEREIGIPLGLRLVPPPK
jgi:hypothetical protein